MAIPFLLLLIIVGVALICLGKYFFTPPFNSWSFGAGVFLIAVAVIVAVYDLLAPGLHLAFIYSGFGF